jgi:hypothetical protein
MFKNEIRKGYFENREGIQEIILFDGSLDFRMGVGTHDSRTMYLSVSGDIISS